MDDGDRARRDAVAGIGEHARDRGAPVPQTEVLGEASSESVSPFPVRARRSCRRSLRRSMRASVGSTAVAG